MGEYVAASLTVFPSCASSWPLLALPAADDGPRGIGDLHSSVWRRLRLPRSDGKRGAALTRTPALMSAFARMREPNDISERPSERFSVERASVIEPKPHLPTSTACLMLSKLARSLLVSTAATGQSLPSLFVRRSIRPNAASPVDSTRSRQPGPRTI